MRHYLLLFSVLLAKPLYANVIWPGLILEIAIFQSAYLILVGLILECLALRLWFGMSWKRAALFGAAMNAMSALLGALLVPAITLLWEFAVADVLLALTWGTFNAVTWFVTFGASIFVNTTIEYSTLRLLNCAVTFKKHFWILVGANTLSMAMVAINLIIWPPTL